MPPEAASGKKPLRKGAMARRTARLHAIQALFQMEASGQGLEAAKAEFEEHRFGACIDGYEISEADGQFFRMLLRTAVDQQEGIDRITDRALAPGWPLGRIDPTLRALFRSAGAELIEGNTPVPVAISEFVEIANAFYPGGKEPKFVNGVLDNVAREFRPEHFSRESKPT